MKLFLILCTILCLAEGETNKATLKSLIVTSDIKARYARTIVSAEYHNDRNSPTEADFNVILPHRAYISNFTMNVGGNLSIGEVKEKKEARMIYHAAIRQGQSAGIVGKRHRFTKQFNMKVNVEPNVKVVFNLTYEELLKRTKGKYSHKIFLSNGETIENVLVEVFISEPQDITVLEEIIPKDLSVRTVDFIDNKHVYIKFNPTVGEQIKRMNAGNYGEFAVEYDVQRINSSVVYTLDGYFVHFFAPTDKPVWPKNIVFMIDVSGSMTGDPIEQVKTALHSILSSLDPKKDKFTFGTFSEDVTWQRTSGFKEAEMFIDSLWANGGTNIHNALIDSLESFENSHTSNMVDILFFLTDGDPTSGITNKADIREATRKANKNNVMLFTLGFGDNCDHVFLKDLSTENNGVSQKIYKDKDSDNQIKEMFTEFSNVMLKNVIITYVDSSIDVDNITKNEFKTFFNGTEIAIAGPLKKGKENLRWIEAVIKAESAQKLLVIKEKLPVVEFDIGFITLDDIPENPNLTRLELLPNITKKTWAYLTLKKMFEDNAPREDIIALAIKNNFVTPLTSLVVTKEKLVGDEMEEEHNKDGATRRLQQPSKILPHLSIPRPTPVHHGLSINGHAIPRPTPGIHANVRPTQVSHGMRILVSRKHLNFNRAIVIPQRPFPTTNTAPTTAPVTMKPTTTAPITTKPTPTKCISTTPPPTTPVPFLPRLPGIFVKPSNCDMVLCVSRPSDCVNSNRMLLLKDPRAGVEVYGYPKHNSTRTCMDDLYRVTLESRGKHVELMPSLVRINRRTMKTKHQQFIRFGFKKFFHLYVFFNQTPKQERISLKFIVRDHMKTATGFYSQYMKKFDCKIQPSGELVLSNMSREFHKVEFTSPEEGFDQCYM